MFGGNSASFWLGRYFVAYSVGRLFPSLLPLAVIQSRSEKSIFCRRALPTVSLVSRPLRVPSVVHTQGQSHNVAQIHFIESQKINPVNISNNRWHLRVGHVWKNDSRQDGIPLCTLIHPMFYELGIEMLGEFQQT